MDPSADPSATPPGTPQYMVSSCRRVHEVTVEDTKAQAGSMLHMAVSRHKFHWALQLLLEGEFATLTSDHNHRAPFADGPANVRHNLQNTINSHVNYT